MIEKWQVEQKAKKNLSRLSGFSFLAGDDSKTAELGENPERGSLIGMYRCIKSQLNVIVCTHGLEIKTSHGVSIAFMPYHAIAEATIREKQDGMLICNLAGGGRVWLSIPGRTGENDRFSDALSFLTFLKGCTGPRGRRSELPLLDCDKRQAMVRFSSSLQQSVLDRPPSSASQLQDTAITAWREVAANTHFRRKLKLVINPDFELWRTISSRESFDDREIAVLCIDARDSPDGWMLYHGLTFRGELVIQTLKPKWSDHGISLPDKD